MIRHTITITVDQTDDHPEDVILGPDNLAAYLEMELAMAAQKNEQPLVMFGRSRNNVSFTVVPGTVKVERI